MSDPAGRTETVVVIPKKKNELLVWLEECYRDALQARWPYERKTLQSLLFWAGDQWSSVYEDMTRRLGRRIEVPPYCEVARIVDNQLPIYIRSIISMATDALSDYHAVPATSDPEDKKAAKLATRLLRIRDREDNEDVLREETLLWLIGSGEILRRTWYNPDRESYDGIKGDIDTELVNIFRYVKDPLSPDVWPPRWLIEMDARHVDWVKARYGKIVEPEDVADVMRNVEILAMNVQSGGSLPTDRRNERTILKRMYIAPCENYPKGRVIVWVKDRILDEHEFQADVYPFSRARWYHIPGRLYAMSYLEPLLSDQRQLNILLSQLQEVKARNLRNDIITQGVGSVREEIVEGTNGQKRIALDPGITRFEFLQYEAPLALAQSEYARLMTSLRDKAGLAEPITGQLASRQTTATELQLLREAGFASMAYHMRNMDRHICEVQMQKIALAKKYYTQARVITGAGRASEDELKYFFGSDLRNTKDVVPINVPRLTPALRRKVLVDAISSGLLGPWLDKDGMPDPFLQWVARTNLRALGLDIEEEELERIFGSYDELSERVAHLTQVGHEAYNIRAASLIQQLMLQAIQGQTAAQSMAAGGLGEGILPVQTYETNAGEAIQGHTNGMPWVPAQENRTPTDDVLA